MLGHLPEKQEGLSTDDIIEMYSKSWRARRKELLRQFHAIIDQICGKPKPKTAMENLHRSMFKNS